MAGVKLEVQWGLLFRIFMLLTILPLSADQNNLNAPNVRETGVVMSDFKEYLAGSAKADWYAYPTYSAYVGILNKFVADHPTLCKLNDLGPSGMIYHRIYCLKISDSVAKNEAEPKYLEINTIHGDELLNMMNCLHMIDTLLSCYATNAQVANLINNAQLFFIPNANPDGTYKAGDNTVTGATSQNVKNGWDLNRNFKCSCPLGATTHQYGLHNAQATETKAIMSLYEKNKFNLVQDHGQGIAATMYPTAGKPQRPWDHKWYRWACSTMVVLIHDDCGNNGYMTSGLELNTPKGWGQVLQMEYECHGTAADYAHYWENAKSIQFETAVKKNLTSDELKTHWGYLWETLFQSYELLHTGMQGIVSDSSTKKPIFNVRVACTGDSANQAAYTDSSGFYLRFVNLGEYTVTFSSPGYHNKNITGFVVDGYQKKLPLSVELVPDVTFMNPMTLKRQGISIVPSGNGFRVVARTNGIGVAIYCVTGRIIKTIYSDKNHLTWDAGSTGNRDAGNGCYIAQVTADNGEYRVRFMVRK